MVLTKVREGLGVPILVVVTNTRKTGLGMVTAIIGLPGGLELRFVVSLHFQQNPRTRCSIRIFPALTLLALTKLRQQLFL